MTSATPNFERQLLRNPLSENPFSEKQLLTPRPLMAPIGKATAWHRPRALRVEARSRDAGSGLNFKLVWLIPFAVLLAPMILMLAAIWPLFSTNSMHAAMR